MDKLSHINERGNAVMVDVSEKAETVRTARAEGKIYMNREAFDAIWSGSAPKGDVLGTARIAGIMAVKKTPELIPLCHTLLISKAAVDFRPLDEGRGFICECTVKLTGKTGAEMEALTGASVALLTIYDMCKALDKSMEITGVRLLEKTGGKSGEYHREKNDSLIRSNGSDDTVKVPVSSEAGQKDRWITIGYGGNNKKI